MPYLSLIDTVTGIVDNYGEGILTTKRFWNILCDLYDFSHENPSLKTTFREIIKDGCIEQLIALKKRPNLVSNYIDKYVDRLSHANLNNREFYCASLFSIAIALKELNQNDYERYRSGSYSSSNSSTKSKTQRESKPIENTSNSWLSVKESVKKLFELIGLNILPFILFIPGICILIIIPFLYYDSFSSHDSIGSTIIVQTIIILIYRAVVFDLINRQVNDRRRKNYDILLLTPSCRNTH